MKETCTKIKKNTLDKRKKSLFHGHKSQTHMGTNYKCDRTNTRVVLFVLLKYVLVLPYLDKFYVCLQMRIVLNLCLYYSKTFDNHSVLRNAV